MSMGTADDLLHYRLQLLQDIKALEENIGKASAERTKFTDEIDALNAEVKKFSTVLVAAGFDSAAGNSSSGTNAPLPLPSSLGGTKGRSSASSVGASAVGSIPVTLQEEAIVTQAELYANVDVMDPLVKDEESLHRLLKSLEKSEKELAEVVERLHRTHSVVTAPSSTAGSGRASGAASSNAVDPEVIRLQAEHEAMQTELRRILALLQRPLGT
jgi:DNA repair exonuclease SbcCD ATPase subunit